MTDHWTVDEMTDTFSGIIGSFITSNWELAQRLIDFQHVGDRESEGVYAARALMRALRARGVAKKVLF